MKQKVVAKLLGICPETLFGWERNTDRHEPEVKYYPRIMNFLGYCPARSTSRFGDRVRVTRMHRGLTLKAAARSICIDPETLKKVELGHDPKSNKRVDYAINSFLA